MKKYISFLLSLIMTVSLCVPSVAASSLDITQRSNPVSRVVINEYDALKELSAQSPATLSADGYTPSEINSIQNYQTIYREHIYNLQPLSDDALLKNGYTTEQLNIIRNFTGSDSEMARLGAELTLYSTPTMFKYTSGGRTTGRLAYNWYWTGVPAIKMRDMVAATWNDWFVTANSSYVSYYAVNTGSYYTQESAEFQYPEDDTDVAGAGHRFRMTKSDNYYYAQRGGGTFDLESDGLYQKDFSYYLEYGHATLSYDIGFAVSLPGGASGSVNWTVAATKADWNKDNYRW